MRHYALIPAKEKSTRCKNKNWKEFILGKNIVEYTLDNLPFFFDKIIVSTDKDIKFDIIVHKRHKSLATEKSPINPTILDVIKKYNLKGNDCIWLLNPTSVFRNKNDFYKIKHLIETRFDSVVSVNPIKPFIWSGNKPCFETKGKRKNTQDFKNKYTENGQFFVFKVSNFLIGNTWYSKKQCLFIQDTIESTIDIDSEEDFLFAQKYAELIETDSIIENETLQIHHLIKPPLIRKLHLLFNHFKRYMDAIERLNIQKNDRVIDASCGLGYGTFILSLHCNAIGLDINDNYLKKAKSLFNLNFMNYNKYITKADKIVCIETIEHIPKKDLILFKNKLLDLLKEGGDLYLTFPLGKDKPSEYNKYHLNEPSMETITNLFKPHFNNMVSIIEKKKNSFNKEEYYCSILLKSHL